MSLVLKFGLAAVCVLACVVLVGCQRKRAGDDSLPELENGEPLTTTVIQEGWTSAIRTEQVAIARGLGEWHALWFEHTRTQLPRPALPEVNFKDEMVVAVFLGERSTLGYGVSIESCCARPEQIIVTARESFPDPDRMQAQVISAPFVMVTAPRIEGECTLEWLTK